MSVINILPPHVADMIAAGEVVERPASVIKELVENTFDAGAKNVTVEIRGGGSTYIRVTDDGCGMSPEDAGIAFLRHATSKLKDERGLESIGTMGFRGEALAAISSVSNIELVTRLRGTGTGTRMTLSGGDIQDMVPTGCPDGTTMIIRDLFFNTPARLKFLKSDRAEASTCQLAALRCALARPDVSLRYIRDGKEELFSPGDGQTRSVIYNLLGRDMAVSMLPCSGNDGSLAVNGFISSPAAGRGNRAMQFFFCNGRFIRSQLLQSAVEQAYKNTLLTGRYPACVLYLTMSFGAVDVNVHPAKTEVKFSDEKKVFDLVYYAVLSALRGEDRSADTEAGLSSAEETVKEESADKGKPASTDFSDAPSPAVPVSPIPKAEPVRSAGFVPQTAPKLSSSPRKDFYQTMSAEQYRARSQSSVSPVHVSDSRGLSAYSIPARQPETVSVREPAAVYHTETSGKNRPVPAPAEKEAPFLKPAEEYIQEKIDLPSGLNCPSIADSLGSEGTAVDKNVENYVQNVENSPIPDHKIVGEAMRTYIIVEVADQLILIDKHAAHERMNFDRMKARDHLNSAQLLMTPVTLHMSGEDAALLESNLSLLAEFGFEIDPFGENDYIVRAVPTDIDAADAAAAVEEICEKLKNGASLDPASARDEVLHTVACKAAIKAGWDTDPAELERIVCEVLSGRVKYCPHGRPVSQVLTRRDLDKLFKRIV